MNGAVRRRDRTQGRQRHHGTVRTDEVRTQKKMETIKDRLIVAKHLWEVSLRRVKAMHVATERTPDWFAETERARAWPLVITLYSGIEQGLKILAAIEKVMTIEELKKYNHGLESVWKDVGEAEREIIEEHYEQFVSLHDYIPIQNAGDLLRHLSCGREGKSGKGYNEWRYCMLESLEEGKNAATQPTSIEAMMQIWDSITDAMELAHRGKKQPGPAEKLARKVRQAWQKHMIRWIYQEDLISLVHEDDAWRKTDHGILEARNSDPFDLYQKTVRWARRQGPCIDIAAEALRTGKVDPNEELGPRVRLGHRAFIEEIRGWHKADSQTDESHWCRRAATRGICLHVQDGKPRFRSGSRRAQPTNR